ncbi:hypothetical protein MHU86_7455 [Fragilaria crotonensis]|nr:hypothetical protein MHU86_7455 [Fragilaria crotonensis]
MLSGGKPEGAAAQHGRGKSGQDGLRLHGQVPVEFVGSPPTDQADAVAVDRSTQEAGHSPTCASRKRRRWCKLGSGRWQGRSQNVSHWGIWSPTAVGIKGASAAERETPVTRRPEPRDRG